MKKNFMKGLAMGVMACAVLGLTSCGEEKKNAEQQGEEQQAAAQTETADPNKREEVKKPADLVQCTTDNNVAQYKNTAANLGVGFDPVDEFVKGNKEVKNVYFTKEIGNVGVSSFQNCTNLENIYSDAKIWVINDYAFAGCTGIKTLDLTIHTIGEHSFEGCTSLTSVKLADLPQMDIREKAFAGCKNLKTLLLGMEEDQIKENAFEGCTGLEEVAIPYNRKDNMYAIVSASKNIQKLYVLTPAFYPYPAKTAAKAFNKAQCEVYVPDALMDDFKQDPNWTAFKALKPLSESGYYTADSKLK